MRNLLLIPSLIILILNKPVKVMEPRFTILTLGVDNLEKAMIFYRDGLGLHTQGVIGTEFEHGAVVFFDLQHGMKLALYPRTDLAWDAKIAPSPVSSTEFSIGYLTRTRDEVDAIMDAARKAGATITKPAQKAFWGGYSGYFKDPDGHLWEIAWNPQLLPE